MSSARTASFWRSVASSRAACSSKAFLRLESAFERSKTFAAPSMSCFCHRKTCDGQQPNSPQTCETSALSTRTRLSTAAISSGFHFLRFSPIWTTSCHCLS